MLCNQLRSIVPPSLSICSKICLSLTHVFPFSALMDSGNTSGSLQSSSGGDEEYDSRADSSSFSASFTINNNNSHVVGLGLAPFTTTSTNNFVNSHTLPPQHRHHNNDAHVLFDPLSSYLNPMQPRSPISPSLSIIPNPNNALVNLDMMWSSCKPARSEPNTTDLGCLVPCSNSSPLSLLSQLQQQQQQSHAFLSSGPVQGQTRDNSVTAAFHALPADLHQHEGGSRGLLSGSAANNKNNDDHHPHNNTSNRNVVRNPKKRSRASRRAPTTVLTTDTNNFRAMVQEFTGIPAQPFTSSSPFPRTRFDLFGSAPHVSAPSSNVRRSTLLDPSPVPPYLLRPFAQKLIHPFSAPSSNSMVENLLASNNNSTINSTSIADHHLGLLKQHPLNFNNNNPILSFQEQSPKYPLGNSNPPSLEIPPPIRGDSHRKVGVFEELGGLSGGGLHQNMVSSSSGNNNNNLSNASTEWAQRTTGTITNDDLEQGGGDGTLGCGTVNYSSYVTERTARSEGMVESWINCSSDN